MADLAVRRFPRLIALEEFRQGRVPLAFSLGLLGFLAPLQVYALGHITCRRFGERPRALGGQVRIGSELEAIAPAGVPVVEEEGFGAPRFYAHQETLQLGVAHLVREGLTALGAIVAVLRYQPRMAALGALTRLLEPRRWRSIHGRHPALERLYGPLGELGGHLRPSSGEDLGVQVHPKSRPFDKLW